MKIKDEFLLRQIGGQTVVLPCTNDLDLNMMITLNETGAFLWQLLQEETDEATMVQSLVDTYDVDVQKAKDDVHTFIGKLNEQGFLI